MKTSNDIINIHVDSKDKEDTIIKGLNMTSKQFIPFEVVNPLYSDELENALKESVIIESEYKEGKRKGYNNANEVMKSILND